MENGLSSVGLTFGDKAEFTMKIRRLRGASGRFSILGASAASRGTCDNRLTSVILVISSAILRTIDGAAHSCRGRLSDQPSLGRLQALFRARLMWNGRVTGRGPESIVNRAGCLVGLCQAVGWWCARCVSGVFRCWLNSSADSVLGFLIARAILRETPPQGRL